MPSKFHCWEIDRECSKDEILREVISVKRFCRHATNFCWQIKKAGFDQFNTAIDPPCFRVVLRLETFVWTEQPMFFLVTIMPRHHHTNGPLAITLSCKRRDAVTVVFEDHGGCRMVAFGRYCNNEVLVRSTMFWKHWRRQLATMRRGFAGPTTCCFDALAFN